MDLKQFRRYMAMEISVFGIIAFCAVLYDSTTIPPHVSLGALVSSGGIFFWSFTKHFHRFLENIELAYQQRHENHHSWQHRKHQETQATKYSLLIDLSPRGSATYCSYCRNEFIPVEERAVCNNCNTLVHPECLYDNDAKCPTYGCRPKPKPQPEVDIQQYFSDPWYAHVAESEAYVNRLGRTVAPGNGYSIANPHPTYPAFSGHRMALEPDPDE